MATFLKSKIAQTFSDGLSFVVPNIGVLNVNCIDIAALVSNW